MASPPKALPTLAGRRMHGTAGRSVLSMLAVLVILIVAWEAYKLVGKSLDGTLPFSNVALRPPPDNRSMPHVWDIVGALFQPAQRGGNPLLWVMTLAALFTLREALLGFLIGGLVGFGLGVLFVRSTLAERSFMPYVVASQTVPIVAIAPMIVIWGGHASIPQWGSVAIVAAYLTFFPVTINTLRGLRSPPATAMELMRSYAASDSQVLWKLQVPAALPHIFTALKIAAAASVVGAIVGELPAGFGDGLGRALLSFSQQFTASPEKLYGAVLMCALAGIFFVGAISLVERKVLATGRDESAPGAEPAALSGLAP